jgi:hypothetical protein
MRVGVTGHTNLVTACVCDVHAAIREVLVEETGGSPLVGVTCLAPGADQVFARVVLELGGQVEVVLPASDYRDKMKDDWIESYDELVSRAHVVSALPFMLSGRQAYVAANERMLASVELLVAVWDGAPSGGRGGTGDVVEHARATGVPVQVVWPPSAQRS